MSFALKLFTNTSKHLVTNTYITYEFPKIAHSLSLSNITPPHVPLQVQIPKLRNIRKYLTPSHHPTHHPILPPICNVVVT